MWGFQSHFRIHVSIALAAALRSLGRDMELDVYLLGFPTEASPGPICIEPEDNPFAPDQFAGVVARAAELYEAHPRRNRVYDAPHVHVGRHAVLQDWCRAQALREALELHDPTQSHAFFVGYSARVDGYDVHTAVALPRAVHDVPALATGEKHDIPITRSLMSGTVEEVLSEARRALQGRDPGAASVIDRSGAEIVRAAARRFVRSLVILTGEQLPTPLYEALNEVATMRYEQRIGLGRLLLANSRMDPAGVDVGLRLRRPFELRQHRSVRKLLELSGAKGMSLLTDGLVIYGLGSVRRDHDPSTESVFEITIVGQGTWKVRHGDRELLHVEFGRPMLPRPRMSGGRFADIATRRFRGASDAADVATLWELAEAAARAEHGTMLVISSDAASEAARLGAQAILIEPARLSGEDLAPLTAIDGAVLLDPTGTVHAIGVILDGTAVGLGDPSRGARYNSAVRYLAGASGATMIVLVSEDGMINLLPDLRPQVSRAEVLALIDDLRSEAMKIHGEGYDASRFNRAYTRVERLSFYLTAEQCRLVNDLRRAVDRRSLEGDEIHIPRSDLQPHPEMDDSYLLG